MGLLPLWYGCGTCLEQFPVGVLWPLDRNPLEFPDVYPNYRPQCGHVLDRENFTAGVSYLPAGYLERQSGVDRPGARR